MVSDIGCSGFFDVFFKTHAFHGLHGRALNYATGMKLCRPDLTVIVTMGDGGIGIGGAHLMAACRRNLDLTLLVLNNFNFGMTGGQCSATTPSEADVASGFLNKLERPLDVCSLAVAAGAPFVCRCSAYQQDLGEVLDEAVCFEGFSLVEIQGICPGRYTRRNRLTPRTIAEGLEAQEKLCGPVPANQRPEFGESYRQEASRVESVPRPGGVQARFVAPQPSRQEVVILGAAGQRIITAGEILALAGLTAGMHATQKNEYDVTVLRGPSISDVILSPEPIDFHGSTDPSVVVALSQEGVNRREYFLLGLGANSLVMAVPDVELPGHLTRSQPLDFQSMQIKRADWAVATLALLAQKNVVLSTDMFYAALEMRFDGKSLAAARDVAQRVKL
jgi:hypothetical protein